MHAFALLLGSLLAHPWARNIVVSAQRVVTYFMASHTPLAKLREAAQQLGIKKGLATSNKTRFTSVHICLESVRSNSAAFTLVLQSDSDAIKSREVMLLLKDRQLWDGLDILCPVLEPLSKVIMGIQSKHATMADICRSESSVSACAIVISAIKLCIIS
jgi:hypothetical protein